MIDRLNRAVTPTKDELVDYVGAESQTLLKDICAYIENGYNAKAQIDYSGCSGEPGWNFKYKVSGKSICTVYPGRDNFIVLITLNAAVSELFEALSENFSPYTQKLFKSAGGIKGTKWLMVEVGSAQIAEDVKKLLELKFGR